jgi:outer membrane receptor protein involved in Fe transport
VATSRGSQGRLPWDYSLDANVVYQPNWGKGLTLRADVFNLFNKQTAQAIYELHEPSNDPSTTNGTYGQVLRYSAPRSVRLTAQYTF